LNFQKPAELKPPPPPPPPQLLVGSPSWKQRLRNQTSFLGDYQKQEHPWPVLMVDNHCSQEIKEPVLIENPHVQNNEIVLIPAYEKPDFIYPFFCETIGVFRVFK
jgi:hypothetical protein